MKKILLVIFGILVLTNCTSVKASEGDMWDYFGDQNVYGQKPVSDKEFEETVKQLEKK